LLRHHPYHNTQGAWFTTAERPTSMRVLLSNAPSTAESHPARIFFRAYTVPSTRLVRRRNASFPTKIKIRLPVAPYIPAPTIFAPRRTRKSSATRTTTACVPASPWIVKVLFGFTTND